MDYDGNDSQVHNLNVVGECTSKSSSVLRPYALPRFELDDSLQGHLRFDSLLETDAFPAKRSQEENHRIVSFCKGSDVIDFSSTATESCSIYRQSHVWFDAASSESAEMFLKSTGQEQIQLKDIVRESNNKCKELGSLEKEMEPIVEQDNANSASTRMLNDNMLQDELLNNVSGLENQVKTKKLQFQGICLSSEKMDQERVFSSQLCLNDLKEECDLPVTGEILIPGSDECQNMPTDMKVINDTNESSMISCQFQLMEGRDKENCPTSQALPGSGQSDILRANKVTSASTGSVLLTDNLEQHVTKLGNPNGEQRSRSETNVDSIEELDLKFSSDEVDNVTESSLKEGGQGNLVLGSSSKSSLIKGEIETLTNKLSNANIVVPRESLVGHVSWCSSTTYVAPTTDLGALAMMKNMSHDEPIPNQLHSENEVKMETDGNDTACSVNENGDINKKVAAEAGAVCEAKSGDHYSSTALPVSGTNESLIPVMETCVVSNGSKSPTSNSGQCSKRSELFPDCDDSVLDKDSLKHECNSPTIISSVITTLDGGNVKGEGGSEKAENRLIASQDMKGKFTSLDNNSFTFKVNLPPNIETEKATTLTPFSIAETHTAPVDLEDVSTPAAEKIHAKLVRETSGKSPGDHTHGIPNLTSNKKEIKKQLMKNDVPTSNLPGLNASALKNHGSPLTDSRRPFTELQQIQLRAQIFVYGSLIQGTAPDEACMISAFRSSGRVVWETIWQVAMKRSNRQTSKPASESPMNSRSSGAKVLALSGRKVSPKINVFPSSVSQAGSKSVSRATLSPLIPSSSPLWSFSTHHTPPVQNHTTWKPQSQAFPSPWLLQPSAVTANASLPTTAITEVVKLTPLKDLSSPAPSFVKNFPSPSSVYTDTTSTVYARHCQLTDQIKASISSEVSPADTKPRRRRKKAQPLDSTPQNLSYSQAHTETMAASSLQSLTGNVSAGNASAGSMETLPKPRRRKKAQPLDSIHSHSLLFSQAQTEAIVSSSLTACSASQQVGNWDMGKASAYSGELLQKVEGARLLSEEAAGLAATALSYSRSLWNQLANQDLRMAGDSEAQVAAASVAKAAAAAASVAEAASAAARVASNAALQAKLMADEAFIPIADAAAAKRAENLHDIQEAAKLAAKAVSQAGNIVAIGDPLPLKEVISAAPEGYWKLPKASSPLVVKPGNESEAQVNINNAQAPENSRDPSNHLLGNITTSACSISVLNGVGNEDPSGDKSINVSDVFQSNSGLSELTSSSGTINAQNHHKLGTNNANNIKEGSVVEVYKDGETLKPAWFSAIVLTLNKGKAHVQYTSLLLKEGSDQLKEWVALDGEGDKAPRIRPLLPMTASQSQGTRKRRRSALGNHVWMVGDMVDVRIQDSWYEGIVTGKNENDEGTLTVHFPARGETSAVSAQQLRFSRMWTDGNWVLWSRLRSRDSSNESDMPLEKRARLKSPLKKPKSEGVDPVAENPEESELRALSASHMKFNVGKSSKAEIKPKARRPWNSGLLKEGSGVVFGVPKPGKKRKFVEASKQFPASQNAKYNESKDQVKFAKRGDTKEKQPLKVVSLKTRNSSSRTMPKRGNVVSSASSECDQDVPISEFDAEKSAFHEEDTLKLTLTDHGSSGTIETGKRPQSKSSTANRSDLPNSVYEENAYDDNTDSSQAELEPRRSNRRIQPTHKLLEGLQSSQTIPKVASVPYDKGQKSRSVGASSRGK